MTSYKVTSPCGCKSIVKEEIKEITTCDCCIRDLQSSLLIVFPVGTTVNLILKTNATPIPNFTIEQLRGTALVGTSDGIRAMVTLCEIAFIGTP
ncbi:hypothetical protein V1503_19125 [Bacillus sp. SCS-151]|uniref:hypothetical protein n=1 Tax=Nanhaiella sioensis TaxID=3115293 RepID=UPI00397BE5BC